MVALRKKILLKCQQYTFNVSKNTTQKLGKPEAEIVELQKLLEVTGGQNGLDALKSKKYILAYLLGKKVKRALVDKI